VVHVISGYPEYQKYDLWFLHSLAKKAKLLVDEAKYMEARICFSIIAMVEDSRGYFGLGYMCTMVMNANRMKKKHTNCTSKQLLQKKAI
jgi:hypothetical protein